MENDNKQQEVSDRRILLFSKRLKNIIGTESIRAFSRKCNLSDATLRGYLAQSTYPSLDKLPGIAKAGNVSIEWLLTGEDFNSHDDNEFVTIPAFNIEISTGHGSNIDQELIVEQVPFSPTLIDRLSVNRDCLSIVKAKGDSMEPTIKAGDDLLVETKIKISNGDITGSIEYSELSTDGIYIIRLDGHLFAKRLQPDFEGKVYIKSDNPSYNQLYVDTKDLNIIGKVVWFGRKL